MSRIKKLDTRVLTVTDASREFGWKRTEVMFDDKFPFRIMVEVGARYDRGDYDHLFALRRQAETEVSSRGIYNMHQTLCDPEQFAEVMARLIH